MLFLHAFKIFKYVLLFRIGYESFVLHISLESIFHICYFKTTSFSILGHSHFEPI